ncbi:MAG: tRNA (guanosine(46)-N7)-methyltransferase TrmB [Clostridia bacterium]|nr:tRNA (guanosine(46)-N7)-methyltransferase TrmB [Clostridia bacterium]
MRMRRKNNLEKRLSAHNEHLLFIETEDFYKKSEEERSNILDFKKIFGNSKPLFLDVGCGKGGFALQFAGVHPEVNIIGVEKISNVIIEGAERAARENPSNCAFLNCGAENLSYYIPDGAVEKIFLNFSCPYPKNTYKNRRFTYKTYLKTFFRILSGEGVIELKTDNARFFEFSIESLSEFGFKLRNITLDLHNSVYAENNIVTEYEKMFSDRGMPIFRLEACK